MVLISRWSSYTGGAYTVGASEQVSLYKQVTFILIMSARIGFILRLIVIEPY